MEGRDKIKYIEAIGITFAVRVSAQRLSNGEQVVTACINGVNGEIYSKRVTLKNIRLHKEDEFSATKHVEVNFIGNQARRYKVTFVFEVLINNGQILNFNVAIQNIAQVGKVSV